MYKVYYQQYEYDDSGNPIDYFWIAYSGIAWACELDALEEFTKARLEGYTCMIKEV